MEKNRGIFFILLLSFFSGSSFAYNLKGKVTDKENKAVAFANINILSAKDSSFVAGAMSDSTGAYHIGGLKAEAFFLQVNCLGYRDYRKKVLHTENGEIQEDVVLDPEGVNLNEVVVNSRKKVFALKNGILTANVSGTILGREQDITDVLRKIPGMSYSDQGVSVLGKGEPVYYIDGRKVTNKVEVERLLPENISTIQLITNPGSEYDASAQAVVSIKTKKRVEGLTIQVKGEGKAGRKISDNIGIDLNYQKKKWNVFASYHYDAARWKVIQNMRTTLRGDTLWFLRQDVNTNANYATHQMEAGWNYDLSDKTSFGMKYDGNYQTMNGGMADEDSAFADGSLNSLVNATTALKEHTDYSHLNTFFTAALSPKLDYYFYADYVNNKNGRSQHTNELSQTSGNRDVNVRTNSNSDLYGIDTHLQYETGKRGHLTAGYNLTHTRIGGKLVEVAEIIPNSNYRDEETKNAFYLSQDYAFDERFSLNAGLRYEKVNYSYRDRLSGENIDKHYSGLYPNLSLNYNDKEFSHSLSYTRRTVRPSYEVLNSSTVYMSRFMYQVGNPQLQPEKDDRVEYNLSYKVYYLSLSYERKGDYIGSYMYGDPTQASRYIYSWKNYNNLQRIAATLYGEKKIGCYAPTLSLYFSKNFFRVETLGGMRSYDKPLYYADLNNNFTLFGDWLLDLEGIYNSGGSQDFFTFGATQQVNFSIKKSFFNKTLDVNLFGNDIFRTAISRESGAIGNIEYYQRHDSDLRQFGISFIYRFNNYKQTYKGKSAAEDEINRL